jgi:hypothetical protein
MTQLYLLISTEVGPELNWEKTKYMVSRYQNEDQNRDMKRANRSFENTLQNRYLGTTVTNQNLIQTEIKRRLNSDKACYHSVQNLFPSCLPSKNLIIRIYTTIILSVVVSGCRTLSLTLREEYKLTGCLRTGCWVDDSDWSRPKSGNKNRKQIIWKCVTVQVFGNDSSKSKFDSGGNQEEIEFW